MRNQYRVLAEKYSLVNEGLPSHNNGLPWWYLEKTDYWYKYISKTHASGRPVGLDIIDWFNKYGLQWAFGYEAYEKDVASIPVEDLVGIGFLDWLRDAIIEKIQKQKAEDFSDYYENEKKELESEAEQRVVDALYHDGLIPWIAEQERIREQKRLDALNKGNPGIEMDI
jgi:hypothetical protein